MDVAIPLDLWEGDSQGVVTTWLFDDGATVADGDVVAEVMIEKVQHEIAAPAGGTLHIDKQVDDVIQKGDIIGTIDGG